MTLYKSQKMRYEMKNKKYHTVRTVPKSNRKTKNITMSELFQNLIEQEF